MGNIYLFVVLNGILLLSQTPNISCKGLFSIFSSKRGRLLTPEEGCGFSKVANKKIVGGAEAKPGAYPWIAMVGQTRMNEEGIPNDVFVCVGALITSRHVLTAAHCLIPHNTVTNVRLGEHDYSIKNENRQDIKVIKAVGHPNYNLTSRLNDIAILTLEYDVDFDDHVRPICLPLNNEFRNDSFVGTNPFVAGWGRMEEQGVWSKVLKEVQLPVLENKLCEDLYSEINAIHADNQFNNLVLCAGNLAGGQDGCKGDSGGPLMLPFLEKGKFTMYQIGVVAYSVGCARPNVPGVYTRISEFMTWIQEQINQK